MEVSSGAKVVINIADFDSSMRLKNAIEKEFADSKFEMGAIDLKKSFNDLDISVLTPFLKTLAQIDSSQEVYDAIFVCLLRCTYNGDKITKATFEEAEARADYYEIVFECLKVNLLPFFKGLALKLNLLGLLQEAKLQE